MGETKIRKTSSQVMELQQLIAGPLMATIEADALSTQKYLDYLMRIAFETYNPKTGETGKLRMLSFSYNVNDVNGTRKKFVRIPLLTLVPLPLLHIEEADFDFDIRILDALSENVEEKFSVRDEVKLSGPEVVGFKMRASLAPQGETKGSMQKSLSANMKVKVKMRQADMPAGLSNLLHITANNVEMDDIDDMEGAAQLPDKEGGENE